MTEITFKLEGPDLASRRTAASVRHNVISHVASGKRVVVDLSQVESISFSYADELFGVIAAVQGWDWLTKNVEVAGANQEILRVIAESINRRLKETGQPVKQVHSRAPLTLIL